MPSDTLFEIGGLSRVWVLADIYESEAPLVHTGDPARMSLSSLPGRVLEREGDLHRSRARRSHAHGEGAHRVLESRRSPQARDVCRRHARAAARPGPHRSRERGDDDGHALPGLRRARAAGASSRARSRRAPGSTPTIEIREGLQAGDQVVTQANFLVDSESRLKAALAEPRAPAAGPTPASPEHRH